MSDELAEISLKELIAQGKLGQIKESQNQLILCMDAIFS
jgi:hypothetical protein